MTDHTVPELDQALIGLEAEAQGGRFLLDLEGVDREGGAQREPRSGSGRSSFHTSSQKLRDGSG